MRARSTAEDRRGAGGARAFTLIELAAALAIMALAVGLVAPAIEGGFRTRAVWRATRQFASTLRHLRSEAVASGEIQQLRIEPEQNLYRATTFDRDVVLPSDAEFVSIAGGAPIGGQSVRVLFFPNGGTSGLSAVLGARGDAQGPRYVVILDPLIGSISIEDGRA